MLLGVVMSKNMVFPTLEPALPKLPNTPSKGYLENFYNKAASYAHKRMTLPTKTHLTLSRTCIWIRALDTQFLHFLDNL